MPVLHKAQHAQSLPQGGYNLNKTVTEQEDSTEKQDEAVGLKDKQI